MGRYDPLRSNVSSLLLAPGAHNSTSIVDATGRPWTAAGNACIKTDSPYLGGGAIAFDGAGDYIHTPADTGFAFPGDFSIELLLSITNGSGDNASLVVSRNGGGGALDGLYSYISSNGTNYSITFAFGNASSSSPFLTTPQTLPLGTPLWMELWREGRMFGVSAGGDVLAVGISTVPVTCSRAVWFGWDALNQASNTDLAGRLYVMRVTKGRARRSPVPTVRPTILVPNVSGIVTLGTPPDPAERQIALINPSAGYASSAVTSDAGDGSYSVDSTDAGPLYAVAYIDYGSAWSSAQAYSLEARCITRINNMHWYEVETAGTSGTTEPTWPTDGSTVTDGTVVWRDKGYMEIPWVDGPYLPAEPA